MRKKLLCATAALGLVSSSVAAQSLGGVFSDNVFSGATDVVGDLMGTLMPGVTNFRLGLGPVVSTDYEGGNKYDVNIAPLISLRYKNLVEVDNNQVRVNLFGEKGAVWESTNFRAGPTLKIDFGRSEKDSLDLRGLGNVGTSFELGAFASYTTGPLRYRVRMRQDVASGHKGMLGDADVSLAVYRTKTLTVGSRLGATWANKKYMTSYFGVTAAQALASGLPAFTAGSGLKDISLGIGGEVKLSPQWAVVVNGGVQRLLGKAKSSPIVNLRGSPNQLSFGAYVAYAF